ncbi:hypothetical protein [Desulfobacter postgatei]|jgi:hypothetical protein|uniref:hypothetical protein n=1 Tax=Desulfobacter postgatei TaxID=2293 RepID=UPI002A359079|nr:hypothetical protein [Desulfobacter postgatei]MDX9964923.1 hypothetical protein [Desulfobacter postgatei]
MSPDLHGSFSKTAYQIATPLCLGIGAGLMVAVMDQRLTRPADRQILVLAAVSFTVGMAGFLVTSQ